MPTNSQIPDRLPRNLPARVWMAEPGAAAVFAALARTGKEARFVGGCVRDGLIGRPVTDIDIATGALPDAVMAALIGAGLKALPIGIDHGTVTAVAGNRSFEITTLRQDIETDGRHAVVSFTEDWMTDASRRDFTMNAMSAGPDGLLHDYFGGLADLEAGCVRFVGDARQRIAEDVLRLLRFFRFHAHYGRGDPEPSGLEAAVAMADRLPGLSGERIRNETLRLLQAANPVPVWRLMRDRGVLAHMAPEAADVDRLDRLLKIESAVGVSADVLRRLAALLGQPDQPGQVIKGLGARLRLSNGQRDRLAAQLAAAGKLKAGVGRRQLRATLYRLGDEDIYRDGLLLAAANEDGPADRTGEELRAALALSSDLPGLRLPFGGGDLVALGARPGPTLGQLIRSVEAWWIAQDFRPDRAACLDQARRIMTDAQQTG